MSTSVSPYASPPGPFSRRAPIPRHAGGMPHRQTYRAIPRDARERRLVTPLHPPAMFDQEPNATPPITLRHA